MIQIVWLEVLVGEFNTNEQVDGTQSTLKSINSEPSHVPWIILTYTVVEDVGVKFAGSGIKLPSAKS